MALHTYPTLMRQLVNELTKLPSIGEKTAIRLAYHLVTQQEECAFRLSSIIREAKQKTHFCEECFALTEEQRCSICLDLARTSSLLCVVEKPADVIALERSGGFRGYYHVLHGLWSPLRGIEPGDIKLEQLFKRLQGTMPSGGKVQELIIATSTTVEGDATALFIANGVSALGMKVTRIAQGLPKGGELEYADEVTLSHALEGRRVVGF